MIQNISRDFVFKALIILITLICFSPCLTAEFVNWDDNKFIYENDIVANFPWHDPLGGLKVVFSQVLIGMYTPLTVLTFVLEEAIWGLDNPGLWHFDNILLHCISILLVYGISKKFGFDPFYAAFITLLFAIHPLRVESVAWVTERKDVLYGVFFFSAIWYYLKQIEAPVKKNIYTILIWIFFILALLTKVLAVTIPVVFVLIDILRNNSFKWWNIWAKWPLFLTSLGFGLLGIYLVSLDTEVTKNAITLPFFNKLILTGHVLTVYLSKLFIPYEMMPIYSFPDELSWYHIPTSASLLIIPIAMLLTFFKKYYTIFFGLSFFLINVIFTLPINAIGLGYMSDRFSYISFVGLFIILAWGIKQLQLKKSKIHKFTIGISCIFIAGHVMLTFNQSKIWGNSESLWNHQIKHTPDLDMAYAKRALYYKDNGLFEKANQDVDRALQLNDQSAPIHYLKSQLILLRKDNNSPRLALTHMNKAIEIEPQIAGYYINRAVLQGNQGNNAAALNDLNTAIKLDNSNPDAYFNRAIIYRNSSEFSLCLIDLNQYLSMIPKNSDIWVLRGQVLFILGQTQEGIESIKYGISINPTNGIYHFDLGLAYFQIGELENAKLNIRKSRILGYQERKTIGDQILNK